MVDDGEEAMLTSTFLETGRMPACDVIVPEQASRA